MNWVRHPYPSKGQKMKALKYAAIALAVLLITFVTAPLWGGCEFNNTLCQTWCEVRHMNNGFDETTCKASCLADKLSCKTK